MIIQNSAVAVDVKLIRRCLQVGFTEHNSCLCKHFVKLGDCDLAMALGVVLSEAHVKTFMQLIATRNYLVDQVAIACLLDCESDGGGRRLFLWEGSNLYKNRNSLVKVDSLGKEPNLSDCGCVNDNAVELIVHELLACTCVLSRNFWLLMRIILEVEFVGFFAFLLRLCNNENFNRLEGERINFHIY
jgi:hypothetical protein